VEQYGKMLKIKPESIHIKFYNVIVASVLVYGSENWPLNSSKRRKIEQQKCLSF
jgi:hypothetical protein